VVGPGRIRGLQVGQSFVRIRPQAGAVGAQFLLWSGLRRRGDSVRVSVDSVPMRVVDITASSGPPITAEGPVTFTAAWVGGAGAPPDSVRWQVDRSTNGPGIDTTAVSGLDFVYVVEAGSYSLQVFATPFAGNRLRGGYAEDYPVCTGSGGGGEGTQRDEGCGGSS
jgi:hypothetical protein